MEKKNGQSRITHCLRPANGQELTETADVCRRASDFYKDLFKCEYSEDQELVQDFLRGLPQVQEEAKEKLVTQLTLEELHTALMNRENGQGPGLDGLTVDFYKAFWDLVDDDLLDVFCDSIARGQLPLSCRRAVLTLLPKKGDLKEIKTGGPCPCFVLILRFYRRLWPTG